MTKHIKGSNSSSGRGGSEADKISVVFGAENLREIERVAQQRSVGVSTLVRQITMDHLSEYAGSLPAGQRVWPEDPELEELLKKAAGMLDLEPGQLLRKMFLEYVEHYLAEGASRRERIRTLGSKVGG